VENVRKGAMMAPQRNISRILSEEGEIPSNLFCMEGVVGRVSLRGKPTHRDASLHRQQCGLVTSGLAVFGRLSENKKWLEPRIEWLNLENEGCSEHVVRMPLHELLKLFPRRGELFECLLA
jgi:hypothetical protein